MRYKKYGKAPDQFWAVEGPSKAVIDAVKGGKVVKVKTKSGNVHELIPTGFVSRKIDGAVVRSWLDAETGQPMSAFTFEKKAAPGKSKAEHVPPIDESLFD